MRLSEEQKKRIINFLHKYRECYSKVTLDYLENNFISDIHRTTRPCEMNQIYAHLHVLPDYQNIYKFFFMELQKNHNIYSNILEIGGGCLPVFAKYIAQEQIKCKQGKITIYDPKLIFKRLVHINLVRKYFDQQIDISNYDLITAIMPCNATELIIKQANFYQKELFLVLCEHNRLDDYQYPTEADWENHIRNLIQFNSSNFDITESRIPKHFGYNYLIFHKTLKKQKM